MTELIRGLTAKQISGLQALFSIMGSGHSERGLRVRGYLSGWDDLQDLPATRRLLETTLAEINDDQPTLGIRSRKT